MIRLVAVFLFAGVLFLDAQPSRSQEVELTDVAGAIYVSGWEVEKEIIIRPTALPAAMREGFPENGVLTPADREALKEPVMALFSKMFTVIIDGEAPDFPPDGVRFIEPDTENLVEIQDGADVGVDDFMIMIKSSEPLPSLDSEVFFIWSIFPEGVEEIPVRIADTRGTRTIEVNPMSSLVNAEVRLADNLRDTPPAPPRPEIRAGGVSRMFYAVAGMAFVLLILKHLKSALVAGLLALGAWFFMEGKPVAAPVTSQQAIEITDRILENVYHAFNLTNEEAQYDQLATVLEGDALESTFLEVRRTTNQREEDGSRVRVRNVNVLQASPEKDLGGLDFVTSCRWKTSGKIGHWGHFHDRQNIYSADISLVVVDGEWKATELDLNSRERE